MRVALSRLEAAWSERIGYELAAKGSAACFLVALGHIDGIVSTAAFSVCRSSSSGSNDLCGYALYRNIYRYTRSRALAHCCRMV